MVWEFFKKDVNKFFFKDFFGFFNGIFNEYNFVFVFFIVDVNVEVVVGFFEVEVFDDFVVGLVDVEFFVEEEFC